LGRRERINVYVVHPGVVLTSVFLKGVNDARGFDPRVFVLSELDPV
jgi:hypothetical protein